MTETATARDLLDNGPGKPAWGGKGTPIGAKITGVPIEMDSVQQRNMDGDLLFFDDGKPRMQLVITLQTTMRDDAIQDDDGQRRIFAKGGAEPAKGKKGLPMLNALRKAQKDAGSKIEVGAGVLELEFTGEDEPAKKGNNGTKLWVAKWTKTAVDPEEIDG
jgi:hypothetical protein